MKALADEIERRLRAEGVALTMGGEPTYVPDEPTGSEWNVTAVGPTKLRYAYLLARALIAHRLPGAVTLFSPGKHYPGETNPRWVVNLVWERDGRALAPQPKVRPVRRTSPAAVRQMVHAVAAGLGLEASDWLRGMDRAEPKRPVWVLPLDHDDSRGWFTERWRFRGRLAKRVTLVNTEGPAGLRLPLGDLPPETLRRALTVEWRDGALRCFLPPLTQEPFRLLAALIAVEGGAIGLVRDATLFLEGYLPLNSDENWERLGLTADPGVLEVNLPPCETWAEYDGWMHALEHTAATCGMRSWKMDPYRGVPGGTGGGNHLLFGGASLDANPFFARPGWVASLLRFFQAHPCLAYLFTGSYVGSSSQAPRPDESGRDLSDLELAYAHLASLPPGDHRARIGETLRHLHTDTSGNTHRSEISFDKFWDPAGGAAALGLVEFRALESLPHARWMSAVALLWRALLAHTLAHESSPHLVPRGETLHDAYFLPSPLWHDLEGVLGRLAERDLPVEELRAELAEIWEWRFARLLSAEGIVVRRACEGWPLLSETPLEGGSTSRFVDTSLERLEISFVGRPEDAPKLRVNGRALHLLEFPDGSFGCGLRYRRTAWHPSLHPGIPPQLPLLLELSRSGRSRTFALTLEHPHFRESAEHAPRGVACRRAGGALLTYDLRL